jgi:LDH2 family malate/lactate/ureidoglycolate dehydrogenase
MGKDGRYITDPSRAGEGFLVPMGGAKGYGLSVMIGLLAGSLNGAAMGRDVVNFNVDYESRTNTGQFLCVISLDALGDAGQIAGRVESVAADFRASAPMPGFDGVRLPGDSSRRKHHEYRAKGIPLPPSLVKTLDELADELGIDGLSFLNEGELAHGNDDGVEGRRSPPAAVHAHRNKDRAGHDERPRLLRQGVGPGHHRRRRRLDPRA